MNDTEVAAMIREDAAEWAELIKILEAHPEESLHDSSSPQWTSRDVYAHIARWLKYSTDNIEALLNGQQLSIPEETDDDINARWQGEDSGMSLTEARRLAQSAFERRLRTIESVPSGRWDEQLEELVRSDGAEHLRMHRSYIIAGNI